jgi:hypothetical protein
MALKRVVYFSVCLAFYLLQWNEDFQPPYVTDQKSLPILKCYLSFYCWIIIVLLSVLEFALRALHFLGRCSTTWAMHPALFVLGIFQIGSCIYAWASLDCDPPTYPSHVAGMTGAHNHAQVCICRDGLSWTFYRGWPGTKILPICTSRVSGITCVNHSDQLFCLFFLDRVSLCTPGCPQTHNPPASLLRAGITGMYHNSQLRVLYIFWTFNPYQINDLQIFSPILRVVFLLSGWCPLKHTHFKLFYYIHNINFIILTT